MMTFYDKNNIDKLPKHVENSELVHNYLKPMVKFGTDYFIDNVKVPLVLYKINNIVIPVTIVGDKEKGSHVYSMYNYFINLSKEELTNSIKNKTSLIVYSGIIIIFAFLANILKLNKCVIINNWLFSTNPHQLIDKESLKLLIKDIKFRFKKHMIIAKSLDFKTNFTQSKYYLKIGLKLMPARPICVLKQMDAKKFNKKTRRNLESDKKFIQNNFITSKEKISETFVSEKLHELYSELYIKKYSKFNASYNVNFFERALLSSCFNNIMIYKKEHLVSFAISLVVNGVMQTPLLGYDASNKNYYRITSYLLQMTAINKNIIDHASSGVTHFKESRGYNKITEYLAWDPTSATWYQRLGWKLVDYLVSNFSKKFLDKYKIL